MEKIRLSDLVISKLEKFLMIENGWRRVGNRVQGGKKGDVRIIKQGGEHTFLDVQRKTEPDDNSSMNEVE